MLHLGWGGVITSCCIAFNIHRSCYVWGGVGWYFEVKGKSAARVDCTRLTQNHIKYAI